MGIEGSATHHDRAELKLSDREAQSHGEHEFPGIWAALGGDDDMSADAERLALLASLGVPMVQPEEAEPDVIEQAAKRMNMTRERFVGFFANTGDETLEDRARRILRQGPGSIAGVVLRDSYVSGRRTEPTMNYRGRWRFPR